MKQDIKQRLRNHKLSLTSVCVDSKNTYAYTASKDGSVIKWCLQSRKIVAKINSISKEEAKADSKLKKQFHTRHINAVAISHDDKYLATGGWDKQIRIYSPKDLSWIHTFTMHREEVTALAFRLGHSTLYSASQDRSVMLWTLEEEDNLAFIEALYGHESPITSLHSLRKERILSAGGRDQTIRIWKIVEEAQTVLQSSHESVDVARYIDDKTFVSGGENGSISVWTTFKRTPVCTKEAVHKPIVNNQATSGFKSGCWVTALATVCINQTQAVTKTNRAVKKLKTGANEDDQLSMYEEDQQSDSDEYQSASEHGMKDDDDDDNDGGHSEIKGKQQTILIASGSFNNQICIWKLLRAGSKHELHEHQKIDCPGFVNDLCFTADGKMLIAACGQEHRFGRWWKLDEAKNCLRIFDVEC